MALLAPEWICRTKPRPQGRSVRWQLATALLLLAGGSAPAQPEPSREYEIKAVFLFNFTQFVEWPAGAFTDARAPLVIGVLGDDPFDGLLDEAVRGEMSGGHPLVVRRFHQPGDIARCHVLFISQSEAGRLEPIFARLKGRYILTVGDSDDFARRGGMVRFVTVDNKIRLRINLAAAKSAGLTISSKLLRPAQIVTDEKE